MPEETLLGPAERKKEELKETLDAFLKESGRTISKDKEKFLSKKGWWDITLFGGPEWIKGAMCFAVATLCVGVSYSACKKKEKKQNDEK